MRGDRPNSGEVRRVGEEFTPHARGSTGYITIDTYYITVYPACAGIDLVLAVSMATMQRLPRMRGDRPFFFRVAFFPHKFTPHARGSTLHRLTALYRSVVYPACAGIDRPCNAFAIASPSLPRMRGDRPNV
mgnify:CR=1 FL=1